MEADADCPDVVIPLAAVGKAIDRAGFAVISTAMKNGLTDQPDDDGPTVWLSSRSCFSPSPDG